MQKDDKDKPNNQNSPTENERRNQNSDNTRMDSLVQSANSLIEIPSKSAHCVQCSDPLCGVVITAGNHSPKNDNAGDNDNQNATGSGSRSADEHSTEIIPQTVTRITMMQSVSSIACRICHSMGQNSRLISPCMCRGTVAYVHRSCLERWLNTSGMLHCELCQFRFSTEHTLRYTFCQSIRLWYQHPNNRGLLQADFLICSLLTVVTFGLIAICMLGLQYFIVQGNRLGVSRVWTQGSIIVFLVIVVFAYGTNLFLILKSQLVPWYRWWQSARQVKLIVYDRRARMKTKDTAEQVIQTTLLSRRSSQEENTTAITVI